MRKREFDFLTWASFPSSAKLVSDEYPPMIGWYNLDVVVSPGSRIKAEVKAKQQNVLDPRSRLTLNFSPDGRDPWKEIPADQLPGLWFPSGTFDWREFADQITVPSDMSVLRLVCNGGPGTPERLGITWFDDLRIYQDGVLIYSNDFSNWDPVIGAGVGAPIGGVAGYLLKEPLGPIVSEVVGAVLGGALGGGVGLLTGLGIIPVPQIPSLGAAPEEPGAPARLGKYQITG